MIKTHQQRSNLEGMSVAAIVVLIACGILSAITSLVVTIGLFIEFGALYGGLFNLLWIGGLTYFAFWFFKKVQYELYKDDMLRELSNQQKAELYKAEIARIQQEQELEALRKRSRLKFCKPRTTKVQGEE